ncbi:MAG: LLM class flavin-dependent oxidoreductase [Candidatus Lustribacter sp.]|jgi:alkanesulfonate monooxygenase SsuD/methylene tetrahydromethanopterin reductase-like flavin-dependent oxidoreductase (luciferase family)
MTQRRRRFGSNAFELGIFSCNVQNGMSKLKEVLWPSTWQQNLELARAAEEAGLEFLLPLGQWRGTRGLAAESDDEGGAYETLTWASGLLAATTRIAVFGTVHVAYFNPVVAAKQCITAHHIGSGRFGLNVVSGNHTPGMFGVPAQEHDAAYDYTEEWVTIVKRIWNERVPFDYNGRYFNLKEVLSKPRPYGDQAPMLISAGHSHRGRAFAMEHADALFTAITEMRNAREEVSTARANSPGGERVPVYSSSHLVCRPTRKEADEYYHYLVHELGDWDDMDALLARWLRDRTLPIADIDRLKERIISGMGTFLALGSYDDVAETYRQLHEAGLDGVAVGMIDYADQFERLRDEVLPRLERMGLRAPARVAVA